MSRTIIKLGIDKEGAFHDDDDNVDHDYQNEY